MKRLSLQILKYISIIVATLYFLLWTLSPQISRPLIQEQLLQHGVKVNDEMHLRFNPFISQIHLNNFQLNKNGTKVLAVNELKLKVNLFELIFKQLYIDIFSLDEAYVKVDIQGKTIEVAGFELPQKTTKKIAESDKTDEINIEVVLPQLEIVNSELDITIDGKNLPININELNLKNVSATQTEQYAELILDSYFLNSSLMLSTQATINENTSELSNTLKLQSNDLTGLSAWLPATIEHLAGEASLSSDADILFSNGNIDVTLSDTALLSNSVLVAHNNIQLELAHQELVFPQLQLVIEEGQQPSIVGEGNLTVERLTARNQQLPEKVIASLARLDGSNFSISNDNDALLFSLPRLNLENALFSYNINNDVPALSQFKRLILDDIKLSEARSQIESVELSGLVVDAQLDQNKQMINMNSMSSIISDTSSEDIESKPDVSDGGDAEKHTFRLGHFSLTDNADIHFNDLSVIPAYKRDFTISALTMSAIDSQQPELETVLAIMGQSNEYVSLAVKGHLQPFLDVPVYGVEGSVKEVSLPAISSYIKSVLKHEIKSGQLDLGINANVTGTVLSGDTEITIRGLDFTASDDFEVNSIKDQTAIPLSVALGMLKDSQGNVTLDIPLSGDTNEPSFGTSGFLSLIVKQATLAAAKDYLLTTFVPYANVISLAMTAGEQLLKVRFNDLNYLPKQTTIEPGQKEFTQQFAQLLQDKPDTQVTICPVATAADVGLKPGSDIVDKVMIDELIKLSEQRFHTFKKHVVNHYRVESSRLLMCSPQIDSDADAKPRLTFST